MNKAQHKIAILGGGTAGWMTANLMARSWGDKDVDICLIESPEIGTVGVGEGSTPQLKAFFDFIGITEAQWMPACNATYKTGISFANWSSRPGFEQYFHPFPSQTDDHTAPGFFYNSFVRRQGADVSAHPNRFFLSAYLAQHQLAPIANYNFPLKVGYGYHFDASLLGQFLRQTAISRGVHHIEAKIEEVKLAANGDIASLQTQSGQTITADLFVDCSGFGSILMQKSLAVKFIDFGSNLFNDRAVALATPVADTLNSQTISTAMRHGWAWDIPLRNRTGNGYVFSSNFCSEDQAEIELRQKLGLLDSPTEAKHLKMRVGRLAHNWHRNCVAIGLSQGFIEPLEATALHLVQESVTAFIEAYDLGNFSTQDRNQYNDSIAKRCEAIRDYIVCHYRVNSRSDSEYWRANSHNQNLSDSLKGIINCWMAGDNLSQEIERQGIADYYPSMSWHCLLAGYGLFPDQSQLRPANEQARRYKLDEIDNFIQRCALNYRSHTEVLTDLA